jgi:hypothetical protein
VADHPTLLAVSDAFTAFRIVQVDHRRDPPPERSALRAQRRDGGGRSLWTHLGNPGCGWPCQRPDFTVRYGAAKIATKLNRTSVPLSGNDRSVWMSEAVLSQGEPCISGCEENLTPRLFLCGLCRHQVLICRRCDCGQMYSGHDCALEVRRSRQREARRRYQASERGRQMHARSLPDSGSRKPARIMQGVESRRN